METALMLAGGLASAAGSYQSQQYAAQQSKVAAQVARTQADQVDASYRQELNATIATIRTMRAGAGVAANSPTGLALEAGTEKQSNRDRKIDVGSKRMQATQAENDSRFRKSAAYVSLFGGTAAAVGKSWGGLSDYFGS